jgi:hypothetical protein
MRQPMSDQDFECDSRSRVCLSTSVAGMQSLFENVWAEIEYPCFVQGSASKGQLPESISRDTNAVLFARRVSGSVDVRGEQLSV